MPEQTAQEKPRMGAFLNGFHCDPCTAEEVATHPGGDDRLSHEFRSLDESLYLAPEGHWFAVRALTPDEAFDWLQTHGDAVALRKRFPAND